MELPRRKVQQKKPYLTIEIFLIIMMTVIGIQGTYLGYMVGILTNLERRFGITSRRSGTLLSMYDVGHTVAVVLVGILATNRHLPRITAIGVLTSGLSMLLLALPVVIFGTAPHEFSMAESLVSQIFVCRKVDEHTAAFRLLAFAQLITGIAAAPFNTVAYVYIDDNLKEKNKSPFYLGLLTSMYAFCPAFGFALSAGLTRIHTSLFYAPPDMDVTSEGWVGAWWLGFLILAVLYLVCSAPLFFFPKTFLTDNDNGVEMHNLPFFIGALIRNPVFTTMVIAWTLGSYNTGGYNTYLPKFLETQYARTSSEADIYAGIISIGSVAVSTALGGYLLTRFDLSPRKAILLLACSWSIIIVSYLLSLTVGCTEPSIQEIEYVASVNRPKFMDVHSCNWDCECSSVNHFNPVHDGIKNYFSPCHAGCLSYNTELKWDNCLCTNSRGPIEAGLYTEQCNTLFAYVAIMFVGLFFGNLFFMTTMMVILRAVYDDQKVLALSFASCITNLLGFIPAPVLFGFLIDSACLLWRNPKCLLDRGNCVIYDNRLFRVKFHVVSAGIHLLAVLVVIACYFISLRRKFPEEEDYNTVDINALEELRQQHESKAIFLYTEL
uniref:MFS domain-containing protein n=1 Tax=Syphacia muris TaxID=451379 RepID=A0A0N5AF54_9BILA